MCDAIDFESDTCTTKCDPTISCKQHLTIKTPHWFHFYIWYCYLVNGKGLTRQDEDIWLMDRIKTFDQFDFEITFGGKGVRM
jgi:hypothetical protein